MNKGDWTLIDLPAEPHDALDWKEPLEKARSATQVFWRFRLGLEQPYFPFEDELRFQALSLALKRFATDVWPLFQEKTVGSAIYRGPVHLPFSWTDRQKQNLTQWLEEQNLPDTPFTRHHFCLEAFVLYCQMLAHRLPDEMPMFLLFDERELTSPAQTLSLLSKERFAHFTLGFRSLKIPREGYVWDEQGIHPREIPTSTGLMFPDTRDLKALESFDELLSELQGTLFKIVLESSLTEEWEGLDELIVLEDYVGPQGVRKLKGFCAAGGEIVYKKENRGRGIRTPDLLVPNQPR